MKKLYGILRLESSPFEEWYAQTNLIIKSELDVDAAWTECLNEFESNSRYTKKKVNDDNDVIYYSDKYSYRFKKFEIRNNIDVQLHVGC